MPLFVRFNVVAVDDAFLPVFTGGYVRGFFYGVLGSVGEDVAREIHDKVVLKPFAVSPLRPVGSKLRVVKGSWLVKGGDACVFDVKVLDDSLAGAVVKHFFGFSELSFGKGRFEVTNVELRKESFKDLVKKFFTGRVGLNFHTPTFFRVRGRSFPYLFPDLRRVAGNLLRLWNAFAGENLRFHEDSALGSVEETAYVRSYRLETREVVVEGSRVPGFKGRVEVVFDKDNPLAAPYLVPLLHFAEYSNVGELRTYGFGSVSVTYLKSGERTGSGN